MKHFAEHDRVPPVGFSPDSAFPMIHAEKGQINPTLTIAPTQRSADADRGWTLLSFVSGDQGNSVPDKAEAVVELGAQAKAKFDFAQLAAEWDAFLQAMGTSGRIEQVDSDKLAFTLAGKPAHGMAPHEGVNAGTMLACFCGSNRLKVPHLRFFRSCQILFTKIITGTSFIWLARTKYPAS